MSLQTKFGYDKQYKVGRKCASDLEFIFKVIFCCSNLIELQQDRETDKERGREINVF